MRCCLMLKEVVLNTFENEHQRIFHFVTGRIKGTRGVQHGVWTRLHSFLIIRESIDKATNGGQHEIHSLTLRPIFTFHVDPH